MKIVVEIKDNGVQGDETGLSIEMSCEKQECTRLEEALSLYYIKMIKVATSNIEENIYECASIGLVSSILDDIDEVKEKVEKQVTLN
jgi:hypothetical protein